MARLLLYLLFGIFFFALAAAGSWIFFQQQAEQEAADAEAKGAEVDNTTASTQPATVDGSAEPVAATLRGRPMSAEEAFRYGAAFRNQQEALSKRGERLQQEQMRVKLMQDDLKSQQRELEGVLNQVRELLKSGEEMVARIADDKRQLAQDRQAARVDLDKIDKAKVASNQNEQTNVKQVSGWFQSMPAENAAEYLRELSNDGKMSSALELLSNIEERDAAKILVAMKDPALVAQLTEKFRVLKRPEKKSRR